MSSATSAAWYSGGMPVREIPVSLLAARLEAKEPTVIVDVREPWELERAALTDPGVVAIPLGELAHRVDEVPPGAPVIVICHHGVRSLSGAAILQAAGREALSLAGGIHAWALQIDPKVGRY